MKLSLRNSITLLVIGAYLILNYGFMLVRIPPMAEGGVPIGELLLLFWFCFLVKDLQWLPIFTNNIIFVPFLMWWALGFGRVLLAFPEYGMWTLRDATHVIESLFLWVGFVFAATPSAIDHLFVWIRRVLAVVCIYVLSYPWRESLGAFSPTITSATGLSKTVFFQYNSTGQLVLWEAVHRLIRSSKGILIPGLLIAYVVGIFQARTIYLQVIAILLLLFWHRPKAFGKMGLALSAGLLGIILIVQSGIEIKGRMNENISLEFMVDHFYAIAGIESKGVVGAAKGVGQRLGWWKNIIERVTDSPGNFLFGLGYGFPLVNFHGGDGAVVREPHNSYLSTLGRIGILGIIFFTWMHVHLVRAWFRAYHLCRRVGYRLGQDRLFLLMVFFVLVWVNSLGEDAFEKPYLTIPYYFFWGVVLHYRLHLKRMLTGEEVTSQKNNMKESVFHAHPDSP